MVWIFWRTELLSVCHRIVSGWGYDCKGSTVVPYDPGLLVLVVDNNYMLTQGLWSICQMVADTNQSPFSFSCIVVSTPADSPPRCRHDHKTNHIPRKHKPKIPQPWRAGRRAINSTVVELIVDSVTLQL